MCSVCFRSKICMPMMYKSSKETSERTDPKPPRSMDIFSPPHWIPGALDQVPADVRALPAPPRNCSPNAGHAVWQAAAVRLSRGWQMFAPWRKSWCWRAGFRSGTQHRGLLVSLREGKAGLHLPAIAMCEDVLFFQKPHAVQWGASASYISYHFVQPLTSSFTAQRATNGRI